MARVGHLDERFTGYGFEDNDYCRRVDRAAMLLGTYEACVVRHGSPIESTFRSRHDFQTLYAMNDAIYKEKWKGQS